MDAVYVISLRTAVDRQKSFKERFRKAGANPDSFNWYIADRNNENPEKGCFDSHQNVLRLAKKRNEKCVLVLEDDATFLKDYNWENVQNTIDKFLELDIPNWKYFQLGYIPMRTRKIKNHSDIVEVLCSYDGHAYLINVKNVKPVLYKKGDQIDALLFCQGVSEKNVLSSFKMSSDTDVYASVPMRFGQELKDSSIDMRHLNQKVYLDYFTDPKHIEMTNSVYVMHLSVLIFFILFLLLILPFFFIPTNYQKHAFIGWGAVFVFIIVLFSILFIADYRTPLVI